ncbi:MAG TPA: ABC transporter ATP-binding protein [Candidatus Eremiobacteraeota bacterium]|nr:MAG: putative ABC transporter ATP-binding protein [bacterium ADurb.Bin363]HPZ10273.1 ABC transporter ATP-binding protein [Candidatus Eremiobacteraeota bacterium]
MSTNPKGSEKNSFIKLQNLTKIYPEGDKERVVLKDISIGINQGEIIVLLGRSGSGKSTLLNLLCGIDIPTSGSVFINDIEITNLSEHKRTLFRRKNIGFIFQFFNLIPTLTVEENLLLPLELNGLINQKKIKEVLAILEQLGLSDRKKSYPDQLSGGEQQRIAIARALSHDPILILADEPTGNLDIETGEQILNILDNLTRKSGKTIIMATHSKEMVCSSRLKDRIVIFAMDGKGNCYRL